MSTLIAVYSGDKCIGRCDANCYEAQHPSCDCVCGGKNHGAGQQQAIQNTREFAEQWVKRYMEERAIREGKGEIGISVLQGNLFNNH